ncbi:chemotaxis protein methyltransferase CheR [Hydrogenimonas sp.]|nr:chemotaxis protein methyltransferase CheR [Hydrogenimonas sp.]
MLSWFKREKSDGEKENGKPVVVQHNFEERDAKEILKEIKNEFGLDYRRQEAVTMRKIERFAIKNGFVSFGELAEKMRSSSSLKRSLINALTVGETYFYRELDQIKTLAELICKNRCSSVLSAPCSSGEEVYSILLYLQENSSIPPSLHITGIDINSDALARAEIGCYSERSVSQLPEETRERYFTKDGDKRCIDPVFKRYTSFAYHNIFDKEFYLLGKFDAVLSRNMMIYFTDEEKRKALSQLRSVLKPGGVLFLGHADISFVPEGFEKVLSGRAAYFRATEK